MEKRTLNGEKEKRTKGAQIRKVRGVSGNDKLFLSKRTSKQKGKKGNGPREGGYQMIRGSRGRMGNSQLRDRRREDTVGQ